MEIMFGEFAGHSRTGIFLHSRNVLVPLVARSCKKIHSFCGKQCIYMSLYFAVITTGVTFVFGANRMRTITLKSPVSVQVWGAISSRGLPLLRKVNGNMDSAKYQSDIIHDIEMIWECVVFPQQGYIFMHDLVPCHNSKSTRTFPECKGISILEWPGNSLDMNPIETVWYIMKKETSNQMTCKKKICGSRYVKCEIYSVAPNVLEQLYDSMPKNWRFY